MVSRPRRTNLLLRFLAPLPRPNLRQAQCRLPVRSRSRRFPSGGSPMANLRRHLFRPLQQTSFRPTPSEVMMTICQSITSARKMTARSMRSSLVLEIWTRRLSLSSTPSAKASQRPSSTLCPLSRQWKRVPDRLSLSGPPRPSLHRHPRLRVPSHQYLNLWLLRRRLSSWRSLTTRRSPSPKSTCGERIS